jgi:hypothetical protein
VKPRKEKSILVVSSIFFVATMTAEKLTNGETVLDVSTYRTGIFLSMMKAKYQPMVEQFSMFRPMRTRI